MGKREKLIDRLTNSPQNATSADINNLLAYEGFYLDRVTDTHHVYIYAETILVIRFQPTSRRNYKLCNSRSRLLRIRLKLGNT
jgi:hypothetical protein